MTRKAQTAKIGMRLWDVGAKMRLENDTDGIYIIDQVVSLYSFVFWVDVLFVLGLGRLVGNWFLQLCRVEHSAKDADSNYPHSVCRDHDVSYSEVKLWNAS